MRHTNIYSSEFWVQKNGKKVKPFTIITKQDIIDGKYKRSKEYADNINQYAPVYGEYPVKLWNPHVEFK